MYSKNFFDTPIQYGYNWGINYSGTLEFKGTYFEWDNFDGTTITFLATNPEQKDEKGRVKWTESDNNYVLWVDSGKSFGVPSDFSNNIITSVSDNLTYGFNDGKDNIASLDKILDEYNNKIEIGRNNGQLITYIKDGSGKKYKFEYGNSQNGGLKALKRIALVEERYGENDEIFDIDIEIGGKKQDFEFTYINLADYKIQNPDIVLEQVNNSGLTDEEMLLLTSVKYPDDECISFDYNGLGWLIGSENIDGQRIELKYKTRTEASDDSTNSDNPTTQEDETEITYTAAPPCLLSFTVT